MGSHQHMGPRELKIAVTTCLSTPWGSRKNLGKKSFWTTFGTAIDPYNPTLAHAPCTLHHSDGALKGVDCAK